MRDWRACELYIFGSGVRIATVGEKESPSTLLRSFPSIRKLAETGLANIQDP